MIDQLITNINTNTIHNFFESKIGSYRRQIEDYSEFLTDNPKFQELQKLGEAEFDEIEDLIVFSCKYDGELTSRSSKKQQYEIAKKILKTDRKDAAVFIFYDQQGNFRFSFVRANYIGTKQDFTSWKRYTYFVNPEKPNKTFKTQLNNRGDFFENIDSLLKAFSIDAVTEDFYKEFTPNFTSLYESVIGPEAMSAKQDFALLFIIRIIFIGFVQKRGWLDDNQEFVKAVWDVYKQNFYGKDDFYKNWLEPIFFEALNSPPGREVKYGNNTYTEAISKALKMAPYLNGEIFNRKNGIDTEGYSIPDDAIDKFIDFLFSYNFTIEENTNYDEELELNPEFLGIIFERLVNKEDGAVYTPRTEVDFMCRISLVKWLQKVSSADTNDIYYLFFTEAGDEEDQKQGDFSSKQIEELINLLKNVSICDPASGSGAFPVGMMHVLNEIIENLQNRHNTPEALKAEDAFERKKAIIGNSLYGVEVKQWAVWINQLRLWLSLFVDVPEDREEEFRYSPTPLLPNLDFKIRCGDSLVQRIGEKLFPVKGHAAFLNASIKRKITELKKDKLDFYFNKSGSYQGIKNKENSIYRAIIDEQIDEIKKEIKRYKTPKGDQGQLFKSDVQSKMDFNEVNLDQLEKQVEKLEAERLAFKEEHPLIWNIEFAEIFYDKGGFDIIIGNPPYIRQEDISDPYQKVTNTKKYKSLLADSIKVEYPRHFGKYEIVQNSDLYTYFFVKSLCLLNKEGIHVFICFSSWLDVKYGTWLQRYLLENVNKLEIYDNQKTRSFSTASVNTVISVLEAPVSKRRNDYRSKFKFIAFKESFEKAIKTETLQKIEHQDTFKEENSVYRTLAITKEDLLSEGSEYKNENEKQLKSGKYVGKKWGGNYLRSPEIYTNILSGQRKEKFVSLDSVCNIRRGITSGCNDFFYLTESDIKSFEIEDQFIKPVILSLKNFKGFTIESDQLSDYAFVCNKPKNNITQTGALSYISWGEKQSKISKQGKNKGKTIVGYNNIESLASRKLWYSLGNRKIPQLCYSYTLGIRHLIPFNNVAIVDNNLFEINTEYDIQVFVYLNSAIARLFLEVLGREMTGALTVLKVQIYELKRLLMINPDLLDVKDYKIPSREVFDIFTEYGIDPKDEIPIYKQEPKPLPDRAEIDNIVFDAIGLSLAERKEVYRSVCQLIWNRVSKAKSV